MSTTLRLISSMATRALLAELAEAYAVVQPQISLAVVLAAKAIDQLIDSGQLIAGSRADLVRSGVAVAVRAGAPAVDIGSEDAVRQAVLAARSISFSTGPSGVHLQQLFERWGIAAQIAVLQALTAQRFDAVRALLAWMVSPACATIKTNNGMESA